MKLRREPVLCASSTKTAEMGGWVPFWPTGGKYTCKRWSSPSLHIRRPGAWREALHMLPLAQKRRCSFNDAPKGEHAWEERLESPPTDHSGYAEGAQSIEEVCDLIGKSVQSRVVFGGQRGFLHEKWVALYFRPFTRHFQGPIKSLGYQLRMLWCAS